MSTALRNPPPSDLESPALIVKPSKKRRQEQGGGYGTFPSVANEPTSLEDAILRLRRVQHLALCTETAIAERRFPRDQWAWWLEEVRAVIEGDYSTPSALAGLRKQNGHTKKE